jgi:hypothetical protein
MRGDKLYLAESIVISAVNHEYDRVCSRVVFFPQISHLCVFVCVSLSLSLSLSLALSFSLSLSLWCLRHWGQPQRRGT